VNLSSFTLEAWVRTSNTSGGGVTFYSFTTPSGSTAPFAS